MDFELKLENMKSKIGIIVMLLPTIWLALSISCLFALNPELFQRMGSFGVFSIIIVLAFHRWDSENFFINDDRSLFKEDYKFENQTGESVFLELTNVIKRIDNLVLKIDEREKEREKIRIFYRSYNATIILFIEVGFLGLATLQWGFGDLIIEMHKIVPN